MRLLAILAASALTVLGSASAAMISVVNGDIEADTPSNGNPHHGYWAEGISGWQYSGTNQYNAGSFAPNMSGTTVFNSAPANMGSNIAWLTNGSSAYQTLTEVITGSTSYTLTALFGNRNDIGGGIGGQFGFYAGDVSNIIALSDITDPGDGEWSEQSFTVTAAMLASYVGEQLGIVIFGSGNQLNFDYVRVEGTQEVPLPAAVWLFGSALAGGGFLARRRKKKAA